MKQGYLSQYFTSVAAKRLSAVEADPARSHQHEFNGTVELKKVLGTGDGRKKQISARFVWFGQENESLSSEGSVTWYDARLGHATRSEYRLYFPATEVSAMAQAGDMIFVAKRPDESVMIIVTSAGTTTENQIAWLFGIDSQTRMEFTSQDIEEADDREVDFPVRTILDELGIEVEEPEADHLDFILQKFSGSFPSTKEFSQFARDSIKDIDPVSEPDRTVMAWMDQEEKLFRRLERQIVSTRLLDGFSAAEGMDVEGFISFSLSVQNRRKSRAGHALENHLEQIFIAHGIQYSRTAMTENRAKPDFLFPGKQAYHSASYPHPLLTMLGVKTTCKDRWRQVLSEAVYIPEKHLFTLEPGISENQTDEMKASSLQLVLPELIHETYRDSQKSWLLKLGDFIEITKDRQNQGRIYSV